ncbi:hypothetical protein D0860_06347 [Hortaea werneckii]|uniref:SH3 domain-containing protein n=1 Tax=Hortaea werneckii TaxID=91943 RepID=A0A3M7GTX8_HORWE|nr:hypothetical protein D0860_06347 [Hortaea werneckii]
MKSMQRKFGGLMKRSENQEDVQVVLTEFKTVNDSLERLAKDIREYRNSWEDALKLQYDAAEAFASIYKPIECHPAPEPGVQRSQPAETPQSYLQKCLGLQKLYSDLKDDLRQEIGMIDHKLVRPAEEARAALKGLHKTLKHRENMKLDYERYLSRAEHARKKEMRTAKEEANLATAESNLAQSQIDYQTADDQVKQTFPPVSAAVVQLLPYLMANIVMLQTTLVGQVYTVLDTYTKKYRFPNPAPGDREIVEAWQREFDAFRRELEQGISVIANGKAVKMSMDLPPEKQAGTVTGLGLRNRAGGLIDKRKGSGQLSGGGGGGVQGLQRPMIASGRSDDQNQQPLAITYFGGHQGQEGDEQAEVAPPKPPRPGTMASNGSGGWNSGKPSPAIPTSTKPRIPSSASPSAPADDPPPPPYEQANPSSGPPSRYHTPPNGYPPEKPSSTPSSLTPSTSSAALASAASQKKKKPPPPVPAKRLTSSSNQAQYVTALYDFPGQNPGDLSFREGDRIRVVHRTGSTEDWWEGEVEGRERDVGGRGSFPANYVRL